MRRLKRLSSVVLGGAILASGGCAHQYVSTIDSFRAAKDRGDLHAARAVMSDDPRRWWGGRDGDGAPWVLRAEGGRWSAWDAHFRSTSEHGPWTTGSGWARQVVTESNEYYQLTERGPQRNIQTWWFDDEGSIEGWSIEAIRTEQSYGRVDEFIAWAERVDPDELAYLRPGGEIDPTGDRPQRTRALLNRWRRSVGLTPIE